MSMNYEAKRYIRDTFSEFKGESIFYTRKNLIENFFKVLKINLYNSELTQEQLIFKLTEQSTEIECREVLNITPFIHY